jgi:D-alanyl-D-alanine carboxypeptidase/D-alanyl-D-alanine-endopeptidase (penicillin-binding protein 4)
MKHAFFRVVAAATTALFVTTSACGETPINLPHLLKDGSARVELPDGTPLLRHKDQDFFVPASVLKVATAYCALEQLGADFRFETLFFVDQAHSLLVKGAGDPSLTSETLDAVAQQLSRKLERVDRIIIDTSLFADDLKIDGSERSSNPYDAKNSAFVANYASAAVTHAKRGEITSAEPQTPLTPLSRHAGMKLPRGVTERINLSTDWRVGTQYGGELLAAFLTKYGVRGPMRISLGPVPITAKTILRHRSPQPLSEIVKGMLEYSTNFTANQLFLVLGAEFTGAPATVVKAQEAVRQCLEKKVGWRDFHVEEGSGLSRKNRVTSAQMTSLLASFERYRFLMPTKNGFIAKTGTLRGVSSLAGYLDLKGHQGAARFCILINDNVPHHYKFQVASEIKRYLESQ